MSLLTDGGLLLGELGLEPSDGLLAANSVPCDLALKFGHLGLSE